MKSYFPGTRFVCDTTSSWIELPQNILTLPRRAGHTSDDFPRLATIDDADFGYALKQVLKAQLPDGYPEIDLAAKSMGTSVRTMQRHLTRAGLTYSKLVEFARFELAAEMLKRPNLKMIDIAYALGYQDPSHFSRAFRRFVGQTPREFRSKQVVDIDL
jgi:AraC-like DNA-binding protein